VIINNSTKTNKRKNRLSSQFTAHTKKRDHHILVVSWYTQKTC